MDELERRARLNLLERQRIRYEHDNCIEFFGIVDVERAWVHSALNPDSLCKCNLFRGPNPKQAELLRAWQDERYKVFTFTGGNKLGKTTLGSVLAISLMIGYFPWDIRRTPISKPPVKIRYIGQDWDSHVKEVVEPAVEKWFPKNRVVETRKNNQGIKNEWIDNATKSSLYLMSNRQEVDVFEGWDGGFVIYDEPPRREIRIACARGLAVTDGREMFCATLLKEPWIDREVIKKILSDGRPDPQVFNVHGEIYDNLGFGLTEEGIKSFASKLTEDEKQERLLGVPSYLKGLIYPQFKREIHLKKRFKIPINWMVDIAIDTHPTKPHAVLFMAVNPRNYKYLCDEIYIHGDGTQLADEIIRYITRNAYRINKVLIDSSAKGNKNEPFTTFERIQNVLFRYGYMLETYEKDETGGIQNTRVLLKSENNEPSLFMFNDLQRTIFEIEGYMYDPETFKPQNIDNDMMDNLYALTNENTQWREQIDSTSARQADIERNVYNPFT